MNTKLKDLVLDVDYVYNGNDWLTAENNATLTIEPSITIRFAHTGRSGGLRIRNGATIKAIGTAANCIRFIGTNDNKGSWFGIRMETNSDNQLSYCDLLNAGGQSRPPIMQDCISLKQKPRLRTANLPTVWVTNYVKE